MKQFAHHWYLAGLFHSKAYSSSDMSYFVWRKHENMSPCTGSRVNANYEQIASWGGYQCWTTVVASVLTTRPWPIRQRRISTSWAVSHAGYNSESILGWNDPPLGCLHAPGLAYVCLLYLPHSISLSALPFVHPFNIYILSARPPVPPWIHPSVRPAILPSINPSINLSIYLDKLWDHLNDVK